MASIPRELLSSVVRIRTVCFNIILKAMLLNLSIIWDLPSTNHDQAFLQSDTDYYSDTDSFKLW